MPGLNDHLFYIVKSLIVIQFFIILLLVLATAVSKYFFIHREKRRLENVTELKQSLLNCAQQQAELTSALLSRGKRSLVSLIAVIKELDQTVQTPSWQRIKETLVAKLILPAAEKRAKSKSAFKRYTATQCFDLAVKKDSTTPSTLLNLIKDKVLLVSLNAAETAVKNPSQEGIDSIVTTFSQGRRIQQKTFAKLLSHTGLSIVPFILAHLAKEPDSYARAFCYRLLINLPFQDNVAPVAYSDVEAANLDLKMSAMNYLAHNNAEGIAAVIRRDLDHPRWQIRAIAVKLLGQLKLENAIPLLSRKLTDSEWRVRINAAQALSESGNPGIEALRAVTPTADHYAYEAATQVLNAHDAKITARKG